MKISITAKYPEYNVDLTRTFATEWGAAAWMQAMTTIYGPSVKFDIRTTVGSVL